MAAVPPDGIWVPSPTFYLPQSASPSSDHPAVDVPSQAAHSVHLARNGITGLVLMGSTGEAIHLTKRERHDLIAGCRRALDDAGFPGYPIMAGVLVNSTHDALEWLADARDAGAQWGMVLAPGYFGPAASQDGLRAWYTIVADSSPIPVLIYNYPGVTNNVLVAPDTYAALARHPNIVGVKMSHGNVSHHVQVALHPDIDHAAFRVYSGFGQQLGPIKAFGAAGVIDGLAAIYPRTVSTLFRLLDDTPWADVPRVHQLQWLVSTAEEFVVQNGVRGIKEAIFRELGLGNLEGGRLPLRGKMADGEWEKWDGVLAKMRAVEKGQ